MLKEGSVMSGLEEARRITDTEIAEINCEDRDIRDLIKELIKTLPSKTDIKLISTVERSCKQAAEDLREEVTAVGNRVETLENNQEAIIHAVTNTQDTIKHQEELMNTYRDQLDDYENRDHRQNIKIRDLPERYHGKELLVSVQNLFQQIMGQEESELVEIDRVHRVTSPPSQNKDRPRDVICRFHKYYVKETIMRTVRDMSVIEFEGNEIALFPDLTRPILRHHRMVCPLLENMRRLYVRYRWGFPFCLIATRDGKTTILRKKDDLKLFLNILNLPPMDFPDWRTFNMSPPLQHLEPWSQAPESNRQRT